MAIQKERSERRKELRGPERWLQSPRHVPSRIYLAPPDEAAEATGFAPVLLSGLGAGEAELRSAPAFGEASPSALTMRGVTKNKISSAWRETVRRLNNSPRSGTRETPGVLFCVFVSLSMLIPPITAVPPSLTRTIESADWVLIPGVPPLNELARAVLTVLFSATIRIRTSPFSSMICGVISSLNAAVMNVVVTVLFEIV